jgi:hypothetical protein
VRQKKKYVTTKDPGHNTDNTRQIKKLTLPDGFRVGIANLDNILEEVAYLKLNDNQMIKSELLERVKSYNYIASSAEGEYATALFREYQRKFGVSEAKKDGDKPEIHQHTKG